MLPQHSITKIRYFTLPETLPILYTDEPQKGDWEATPAILHNLQNPALFIDDDGKAYIFWGSSNIYPIRRMELDRHHRFTAKSEIKELFNLDMEKHGWERFGENHSDTILGGYIEGPWLTNYMEYGVPCKVIMSYGELHRINYTIHGWYMVRTFC